VIGAGGVAVPVAADHPRRLTAAAAGKITGQKLADLEELWQECYGRLLGVGATGKQDLQVQAGGGEAGGGEVGEALFRSYWYPELSGHHWAAFVELCKARGLNWRGREVFPQVQTDHDGAERVALITSIEVLRRRAHETGLYGGLKLVPGYGEDGLLATMTATAVRLCGGTPAEFAAVAGWDEFDGASGRPGLWGEDSPIPLPIRMPQLCLGRCAEAMALRLAFPACDRLFVAEELAGSRRETRPLFRAEQPREADGDATRRLLAAWQRDRRVGA
jgi:hypothetical protein